MRLLLSLIIALFIFSPSIAQASFWMECKVKAVVLSETENEGVYKTDIKSAVVTGGHVTKGDKCMEGNIGKIIEASINGDFPLGEEVYLKYGFKNAMGQNGVVESESWSYLPPLMKELLPW